METTRFTLYPRPVKRRGRFTNFSAQRNEHPQKYIVKKICDVLFFCGIGNFWYEDKNLTNIQQYIYNTYAIIINMYLHGNLVNEFLAIVRSDLTDKEKNDLPLSLVGHTVMCFKVIILYFMRNRIKVLLKRFFEDMRDFARLDLENESVKEAKKYCGVMVGIVYFTLFLAMIEGIRMHVIHGIPIRAAVVVFYPTPSHSGLLINFLRVLVELHWWYGVTLMVSTDCICTCCLVFTGYKFRTLRMYFEGLGQKYHEDSERNLEVREEKFIKNFESGILFHKEVLWCTRYVQYALGTLYSVQVVQCIVLLVICLIRLLKVDGNVTLIANLSYVAALVSLTGAYMLSAGDITHEAEMIPTAVFHSGWELTKRSKKIRHRVTMTVLVSQVPVYMNAFGILILSYNNFITVLRCSYSFFAVMH